MQREAPPPANEPVANGAADRPASNPFSTRHVRPGAIPYFFPDGTTLETLVERLAASGWQGEVVGPHGSGKSTLLAALVPCIERTGRRVAIYRLHEGERRLPATPRDMHALAANDVVAVDGYEQLPRWRQWLLRRSCTRRGIGLLATTHAPTGLPLLWQTSVDLASLERVVAHALASQSRLEPAIGREEIAAALAAHPTNAREALFALYDAVERRRRDALPGEPLP